MSSIISLDTDPFQFPGHGSIVVVNPRHGNRCDHGRQNTDAKRDREAFDRTGAELEKNYSGKKSRDVGVDNRRHGMLKSRFDRRPGGATGSQFLANPFVDQNVSIDGHTRDQYDPGNSRQRQHRFESSEDRQQKKDMKNQRQVRNRPGSAIIHDHENDNQAAANDKRNHAFAYGIAAQRRSNSPLLEYFNRGWQCARTQHNREISSLFEVKISGHRRTASADPFLDYWSRVNTIIEHYGEPSFHIGRRNLLEQTRPSAVQNELHRGTLELLCRTNSSILNVFTGHQGA